MLNTEPETFGIPLRFGFKKAKIKTLLRRPPKDVLLENKEQTMENNKSYFEEGILLDEIFALAKEKGNVFTVLSKSYVADYLEEVFGDEVECNVYDNLSPEGRPIADAHYALSENGKKCFVYVYDTNEAMVLIVRLNEKYAESVRESGHRIYRSAFPKSEDAWYSIIVDETYSETDIQEILADAYDMAK